MAPGPAIPSANALGYRLSIEEGPGSRFRSDRIQDLAAIWGKTEGSISLALVLAHEIGHLLLKARATRMLALWKLDICKKTW